MPILDKSKLIFLHVPKTGGSSIEKLLGLHPNDVDEPLRYLSGGKEQLQHLTLEQISELKKNSLADYDVIGVVRHPISRMKSEYKWRKRSDHPIARGLDLNQFVAKIYNRWIKQENLDSHFTPQSKFFELSEGKSVKSINIFKFEDGLDVVANWIAHKLNCEKLEVPRVNHTDQYDLKDDFNDQSLTFLKEMFSDDFKLYE